MNQEVTDNVLKLNDAANKEEADAITEEYNRSIGKPSSVNPFEAAHAYMQNAGTADTGTPKENRQAVRAQGYADTEAKANPQRPFHRTRDFFGQLIGGGIADTVEMGYDAMDFASRVINSSIKTPGIGVGLGAVGLPGMTAGLTAAGVDTNLLGPGIEGYDPKEHNIASYPEPDTMWGSLSRSILPYIALTAVGEGAAAPALEAVSAAAPEAIHIAAGAEALAKYGPTSQKFLNHPMTRRYIGGAFADAVMTDENGGNFFNLLDLAAAKAGHPGLITEYLMANPDDTMVEKRLKNVLGGAAFVTALKGAGLFVGTGLSFLKNVKDEHIAPVLEEVLRRKREWMALHHMAEKDEGAQAVVDIINGKYGDPVNSNGNGVSSEPPMGPVAPTPLQKMTTQGPAADPNYPGNVAAEEFKGEQFEDAHTAEVVRTAKDANIRRIVMRAVREGAIKVSNIRLRRYSKDFWRGVVDSYERAGKPLSKSQVRVLKQQMDNQAVNFSISTGLAPEAYYWYRFSNDSYNAVRTFDDINRMMHPNLENMDLIPSRLYMGYDGNARPITLSDTTKAGDSKWVAQSKRGRFYRVDKDGGVTRVSYEHDLGDATTAAPYKNGAPVLVNGSHSYNDIAVNYGEDYARRMLEITSDYADGVTKDSGLISRTMNQYSLDREGAIRAILDGKTKAGDAILDSAFADSDAATSAFIKSKLEGLDKSQPVPPEVSSAIAQEITDKLHKPLQDMGVEGVARVSGPGAFTYEWFNGGKAKITTKDIVRKADAIHYGRPIEAERINATANGISEQGAGLLRGADDSSSRLGQSASVDQYLNTFLESADAPTVKQNVDTLLAELFPDQEFIPVTRSLGYANAATPDGEFVAVTTNTIDNEFKDTGDKLWVRKEDVLAPAFGDGFYVRSSAVIPEEEYGLVEHLAQTGKGGAPKASITFERDGRAVISLFTGQADFASFIHETGHLFFRDLEFMPNVPTAEMRGWLGVNPRVPFERWPVEAQEKWAKSFENYVATGEAPKGMAAMFKATAEWMKQVYGPIVGSDIAEAAPKEIQEFMGKLISGTAHGISPRLPFAYGLDEEQYVNADRIKSEQELIGVINMMRGDTGGIVNHSTGEVLTFKMVEEQSAKRGISIPKLLGMPEGMDPRDAWALRRTEVASAASLDRLAAKMRQTGSYADKKKFAKAYALHMVISTRAGIESRFSARSLGSRRMIASADEGLIKQVEKVADEINDDTLTAMAQYITDFGGDTTKIADFLANSEKPGFWDVMHEFYLGHVLSSPATATGNALGGAAVIAHMLTTTFAASKMNSWLGYTGRVVDDGEVGALWYGMWRGFNEAGPIFKEVYDDNWIDPSRLGKWGEGAGEPGKFQNGNKLTSDYFRPRFYKGEMGLFGDVVDWYGANVVRQSKRILRSTDAVFKNTIFRMEMHRQAYRYGQDWALSRVDKGLPRPSAEEVEVEMNMWLAKPPVEAVKHAKQVAVDGTFVRELEGNSKRLAALGNVPYVRKLVPFMRIGITMGHFSVREMTPGSILYKEFRERLNSPDPRTAQIARTQLAGQFAMFMAIGDAVDRGILTTHYERGIGNIGQRESQKRTNIPEGALAINGPGGTYVSFNRLEPAGMAIQLQARAWQLMDHLDEQTATSLAGALVVAGVETFGDRANQYGMQQVLKAAQDPDNMSENALSILGGIVAGHIVPLSGLVASLERAKDPTTRSPYMSQEDDFVKEHPSWAPVLRILRDAEKNIPFVSEGLPPNIDIYGDEETAWTGKSMTNFGVAYETVSPLPVSRVNEKNAEYEDWYAKNGWFPEKPPKYLTVGKQQIRLKTDEWVDFQRIAGKEYRKLLEENRDEIAAMPNDGPDGMKVTVLQKMLSQSRRNAAAQMFGATPQGQATIEQRWNESAQRRLKEAPKPSFGLTHDMAERIKAARGK